MNVKINASWVLEDDLNQKYKKVIEDNYKLVSIGNNMYELEVDRNGLGMFTKFIFKYDDEKNELTYTALINHS